MNSPRLAQPACHRPRHIGRQRPSLLTGPFLCRRARESTASMAGRTPARRRVRAPQRRPHRLQNEPKGQTDPGLQACGELSRPMAGLRLPDVSFEAC